MHLLFQLWSLIDVSRTGQGDYRYVIAKVLQVLHMLELEAEFGGARSGKPSRERA